MVFYQKVCILNQVIAIYFNFQTKLSKRNFDKNIMRKYYLLLGFIILFSNLVSYSQDIENLSKKELRDFVTNLNNKISKIEDENYSLQTKRDSISILLDRCFEENRTLSAMILENKTQESELKGEITTLKNKQKKLENEINKLSEIIKENERAIVELTKNAENLTSIDAEKDSENEILISLLKDSIANLIEQSNDFATTNPTYNWDDETSNRNDFLNRYFKEQFPIMNSSFNLQLSKIIYGNTAYDNNNYYYHNNRYTVSQIPEILDADHFIFWGVKPNTARNTKELSEHLFDSNAGYLNSKLPEIEILKNKLLTFKYKNGVEEPFLFNISNASEEKTNNQRSKLEITLADETVERHGDRGSEKDLIFPLFMIESDCYLALSDKQLQRLGIQLANSSNHDIEFENIYISRKQDEFIKQSQFIDVKNLIFLFKLHEK